MSELQIKKIKSSELSKTEVFLLNFYYRTAPSDFVVLYVKKRNMLLINARVPDNDVEKFIRFAEYDRGDIDIEGCGMGKELNYIHQKYGFGVWSALFDCYKNKRDKFHDMQAKTRAEEIYEQLLPWMMNEEMDHLSDERLLLHLKRLANREGSHKTRSDGNKIIFLLGYLMGQGIIKREEREAI